MFRRSAFLVLASLLLLPACDRGRKPDRPDRPTLETAAGEAVLRQVWAECADARTRAKLGIIVVGESMEEPSPAFLQRFADWQFKWVPAKEMSRVYVGTLVRVIHLPTEQQPLQLQLTSLKKREDGTIAAVAAWAFEEKMVRSEYVGTPQADGSWKIENAGVLEKRP